jgi:hypothetical protein
MLSRTAIAGFLALSTASCATRYTPRPSPRVAVVMQGGDLAYDRDGERFERGFFGGGLVDAVEPDPEARDLAETYHGRNVAGFLAYLGGALCLTGGVLLAVSQESDSDRGAYAVGAIGCGLAGMITGVVLLASAQTYHWDAINTFNDNVDRRFAPPAYPPPGYPPPAYAPPAGAPPPPGALPPPPPPAPPAKPESSFNEPGRARLEW